MFKVWQKLFGAYLLCALASNALGAEETKEKSIPKLVKELGAAKFQVRQAAMRALISKGQPAVSSLQKAVSSADPEVRTRARTALGKIFDMLAWESTQVKYSFKDKPFREIIKQVARDQNLDLVYGDRSQRLPSPKESIISGEFTGSFWEVMEQLCDRADARIVPIGISGDVSLRVVSAKRDSLRMQILNGVKFELEDSIRRDRERNRLIVPLHCFSDTQRVLIAGPKIANLVSAVTDSGERLEASLEGLTGGWEESRYHTLNLHDTTLFIESPRRACRSIKRLEFDVTLRCLGLPETLALREFQTEASVSSPHFEAQKATVARGDHGGLTAKILFKKGKRHLKFARVVAVDDLARRQFSVSANVSNALEPDAFGLTASFVPSKLTKPSLLEVQCYTRAPYRTFRVVLENLELSPE